MCAILRKLLRLLEGFRLVLGELALIRLALGECLREALSEALPEALSEALSGERALSEALSEVTGIVIGGGK